jgi:hypothetical protein
MKSRIFATTAANRRDPIVLLNIQITFQWWIDNRPERGSLSSPGLRLDVLTQFTDALLYIPNVLS